MTGHPELALQRQVVEYLNVVLVGAWVTHFPAGGGGRIRGALLKSAGLRAGVPDILIIVDGRARWIELKTKRGRLSEAQRDTHDALLRAGCGVAVCHDIDEVRRAVRMWRLPTRETVAQPYDPEADAVGCYRDAVAEIKRRVDAGEPPPATGYFAKP